MSHPNILLCDVDGVMLNWLDPFECWLKSTGLDRVIGVNWDHARDSYDLAGRYGVDNQVLSAAINTFNTTLQIGTLPPMAGAIQAINILTKRGWTIHAISSFAIDYSAHEARVNNLRNLFGVGTFSQFTLLPFRAPKIEILKAVASSLPGSPADYIYVDDNPHHVDEARQVGLTPFHFNELSTVNPINQPVGTFSGTWSHIVELTQGE